MGRLEIRPLDYAALVLSIMAVVLTVAALPGGAADLVSIQSPEGEFLYPIDEDRAVTVSGRLGPTRVEIAGERVRVVSDPGPRQLCVLQGWITSGGQWLACLPNRVFIEIVGEASGDVDGYAF